MRRGEERAKKGRRGGESGASTRGGDRCDGLGAKRLMLTPKRRCRKGKEGVGGATAGGVSQKNISI